ncbi:MAG: CBS domain-containing protein, partial [Cyanobacteriota bacterium]|nr:CBS domain-containing protein [Cyanobacteriota bacterium]
MVLQQTVKDVMSTPVLSVVPATSLQEAVQLLSDHHISGLPVVNDDGTLVGEL